MYIINCELLEYKLIQVIIYTINYMYIYLYYSKVEYKYLDFSLSTNSHIEISGGQSAIFD